ncbi:MAG: SAM-dependent DNA methyltransferase, partial [Actinomycetes bacterium]
SVSLDAIRSNDYVLVPGRYVGSGEVEADLEPLEEKIARLTRDVTEGFARRTELQADVVAALASLMAATDAR